MILKNINRIYQVSNFKVILRNFHKFGSLLSEFELTQPKIPVRKRRSSTDILKAIASTIQVDSSGPTYKFYDDPYMYPISQNEKKLYSLSKESGRKAARLIRDSHGDYFRHQPDDPVIKEFLPKVQIDENSEVSETDVRNCVNTFQVSDSISLYRFCQENSKDVNPEIQQALLELVSFYNCEDSINPDWIEEMKSQAKTSNFRLIKTWKDGGLAEELFENLKENGSKPYCAIIKGMCSYGQVDRAWQLFQEALDKEIMLDVGTFNAIIRISPSLKEDSNLRWSLIEELFQKMIQLKIPPNLGTMNAVLEALAKMRTWGKSTALGMQVLTEFKHLNIQPSLATYYFLLRIHYTLRNPGNLLLPSILEHLEGKSFTVQDINDDMFFFTAMEICNRDLKSFETAERLNNILMTGDNYNFLGDNLKHLLYYRNYFILCVNSLPFEDFMKKYDSLVPHLYSPDREVVEEIVKNIGVYDEVSYLPRIWSDCLLLEVWKSEKLMEMTLMVLSNHLLEEISSSLRNQYVNIAWDIWTRIQNQNENTRSKIEWTGQMLGDCVSILTRLHDIEKAVDIFSQVNEPSFNIIGIIPFEALEIVFDAILKNKWFKDLQLILKYAKDNDYPELNEMMKKVKDDSQCPQEVKDKLVKSFIN